MKARLLILAVATLTLALLPALQVVSQEALTWTVYRNRDSSFSDHRKSGFGTYIYRVDEIPAGMTITANGQRIELGRWYSATEFGTLFAAPVPGRNGPLGTLRITRDYAEWWLGLFSMSARFDVNVAVSNDASTVTINGRKYDPNVFSYAPEIFANGIGELNIRVEDNDGDAVQATVSFDLREDDYGVLCNGTDVTVAKLDIGSGDTVSCQVKMINYVRNDADRFYLGYLRVAATDKFEGKLDGGFAVDYVHSTFIPDALLALLGDDAQQNSTWTQTGSTAQIQFNAPKDSPGPLDLTATHLDLTVSSYQRHDQTYETKTMVVTGAIGFRGMPEPPNYCNTIVEIFSANIVGAYNQKYFSSNRMMREEDNYFVEPDWRSEDGYYSECSFDQQYVVSRWKPAE